MPYVMIGLMGAQAIMGAQGAKADAAAQRLQFEEAEFQRKWESQVNNRNIAKQNALRWFNNKKIEESANARRAEEEFYINYNWDNQTGAYGRKHKATQDELFARLTGKNINPKSGTARALLRQQNESARNVMTDLRINTSNQLLGAERRQDQALASRDFGYNASIPFMPGTYGGPDPSNAFNTALMSGVVSGAANYMAYDAAKNPTASGNVTNVYGVNIGGGGGG